MGFTRYPFPMSDHGIGVAVCIVGLALVAGCASPLQPSEPESYEDVEVSTSRFFIALEDEGADPVTYAGQPSSDTEFLYEMGLFFCGELDDGSEVMPALDALQENSGLGDDAGRVAGAAVNDLCPEHREAVEAAL